MNDTGYILDAAGIDKLTADLKKLLSEQGQERRDALRICLTVEELLLKIMEANGDHPANASLSVRKRFGFRSLLLTYDGISFDPTQRDDEDWGGRMLQNLGLNPTWSCYRGENRIQVRIDIRKKKSQIFFIFLAAVMAVLVGNAVEVMPPETLTLLNDVLITPVFEAFLGLLNTFAGLMVFLTISSGVFGIGDTGTLSRVGKTMFPRFLGSVFAATTVSVLLIRPLHSLIDAGSSDGVSQAREISKMIFSILPNNPVRTFLEANIMQIVVLAILTGVVILMLGDQTKHVSRIIEESNLLIQTMLRIVCSLIPLFVFVSLVRLIWSGTVNTLTGLWKPLVISVGLNLLFTMVLLISASVRIRVSPIKILRHIIPPFIIAFSTGSSIAAYPTSFEAGEKKLGIRRRLLDIGFPIGIVIYMPSVAIYFASISMFFAGLYHVEVTPAWLIMTVLVSSILAIAVPPVPGAMLTCYGILLAQLGIPSEALLLATALDIVMDFVFAGFITLHLLLEMILQADIMDMLDRETIRG